MLLKRRQVMPGAQQCGGIHREDDATFKQSEAQIDRKRWCNARGLDVDGRCAIDDRVKIQCGDGHHAGQGSHEYHDRRATMGTVEQRYQEARTQREHVNAQRLQHHIGEKRGYHFDSVHSSIISVLRAL